MLNIKFQEYTTLKQPKFVIIFFPLCILFASVLKTSFFYSAFTVGDAEVYAYLYELVKNKYLISAYLDYTDKINSVEFGHFFSIWIFSNIGFSREFYLCFFNGLFSYFTSRHCIIKGIPVFYVLILLIFNFYTDVLFFSAERIKIAIFFLSLWFFFRNSSKNKFLISLIAAVTHLQSIIIIFIINIYEYKFNFNVNKKNTLLYSLPSIPVLFFILWATPLGDQFIQKIQGYNQDYGGIIPFKTVILSSLLILCSSNTYKAVIVSFAVVVTSFLLGDGRVNFIVYYLLFFECFYARNWYRVLIGSCLLVYGAIESVDFISNALIFGTGFDDAAIS